MTKPMSNYGRGRKPFSLCEEENLATPVLEHVLSTAAQDFNGMTAVEELTDGTGIGRIR